MMTSKQLTLSQITSFDFSKTSNEELLEIYEKLRIVKNSVKELINKRKKELDIQLREHFNIVDDKKKKKKIESDGKGGNKKKKVESDGKGEKKKKKLGSNGKGEKKKITKNKMMVLLIQNNIDYKKDLNKGELEALIKKHHLVRKLNALYKFPS